MKLSEAVEKTKIRFKKAYNYTVYTELFMTI